MNNNESSMRNYENKTKEDLLEIIEQLEKKIDFLSSHSSDSSSPSKGRFRDKYSTRILDALPDMLTVFDHDANIIELASSPATNHVEGISPNNITTTNVKDILPKEAYESVRKNMDKVILTGESSTARHDLMLDGVLHHQRACSGRYRAALNGYLLELASTIFKTWFMNDDARYSTNKVAISEIAVINAGGDKPNVCQKTPSNKCPVPVYSNGTDNEGLYGYTSMAKVTEPSVTVSARGTIGFTCLRHQPYYPIVRLISATPKEGITVEYLYLWLRNKMITGVGTTQQQLTVPMFKKYEIDVPSARNLTKFTEIVRPLFNAIAANKTENTELVELRNALLPKLMSGEIDVSKIDLTQLNSHLAEY